MEDVSAFFPGPSFPQGYRCREHTIHDPLLLFSEDRQHHLSLARCVGHLASWGPILLTDSFEVLSLLWDSSPGLVCWIHTAYPVAYLWNQSILTNP